MPSDIKIFGNIHFRGDCKSEEIEQQDFVAWLRLNHPVYAAIMLHPKNEGGRSPQQSARDKKNGCLNTGASDIIIPAAVSFVCELKRRDHTKSSISNDQVRYIQSATSAGSFGCVALGFYGAREAFECWLDLYSDYMQNNPC